MPIILTRSSPEEDAAIAAAIAMDPDAAPDLSTAESIGLVRRVRRPEPGATAEPGVRLDPDVLAYFRATGPNWQGRVNDVLRKAVGL